ncbi:MAG: FecR domain-containing protein [Spirochaetaceae bacterium]
MRTVAVVIMLTIVATAAFAQSATFEEVNGKVEIRRAGGSWEPAEVGMSIDRETTISTGFGATAELTLADSTLEVEQLTRMTLVGLVESSDEVDTEVFLDVGRVSADVRTAERRQAFEVRSPVSTAAVRGTRFRFDGQRLQVFEGNVAFGNAQGESRNLGAGQQSTISDEGEGPSSPQQEILNSLSTNINPVGLDSEQAPESFGQGRRRTTRGGVTVELTYN